MKLIKKITDPNSLKLKKLMNAVNGTCSFEEKVEAKKVFEIYLNKFKIIK